MIRRNTRFAPLAVLLALALSACSDPAPLTSPGTDRGMVAVQPSFALVTSGDFLYHPNAFAASAISPNASSCTVGATCVVDVGMWIGTYGTYGIDFKVYFNPAVLQAISVTTASGSPYPNSPVSTRPANSIDNINGIVSYSAMNAPGAGFSGGSPFAVATIVFNPIIAGTSTLNLRPNQWINAYGPYGVSGLATSGTVSVTGGTPSDVTPPIAAPTLSPAANGAGWNNTNVTASWHWTDEANGSGIDAANCTASRTSVGEGTIGLSATCKDLAGNAGSVSMTVKVDKTAPVIGYSGNGGSYTVDQTVAITCSASDALSGLASTTCANVTGAAYTFAGTNSFSASATDKAGNSNSASTSFTVAVTAGGVCALVERWVSSAGVANSMCVKLRQGSYGAFRNEVEAQSGKKLSADNAAILLRLINLLG